MLWLASARLGGVGEDCPWGLAVGGERAYVLAVAPLVIENLPDFL